MRKDSIIETTGITRLCHERMVQQLFHYFLTCWCILHDVLRFVVGKIKMATEVKSHDEFVRILHDVKK